MSSNNLTFANKSEKLETNCLQWTLPLILRLLSNNIDHKTVKEEFYVIPEKL